MYKYHHMTLFNAAYIKIFVLPMYIFVDGYPLKMARSIHIIQQVSNSLFIMNAYIDILRGNSLPTLLHLEVYLVKLTTVSSRMQSRFIYFSS